MNANNPELIRRTAEVAAQWWADRLLRGDKEAFREDLEARISDAITKAVADNPNRLIQVENDYDPRGILLDAVRATVDLECKGSFFSGRDLFPDKHALTIRPGLIKPKEGYGNWTKDILVGLNKSKEELEGEAND